MRLDEKTPARVALKEYPTPIDFNQTPDSDTTITFFRTNEGPEVPNVSNAANSEPAASEHYESNMACSFGPEISSFSGSEVLNEVSSIAHSMFHFIFMNIGHLISIHKQKLKFLADISNDNT